MNRLTILLALTSSTAITSTNPTIRGGGKKRDDSGTIDVQLVDKEELSTSTTGKRHLQEQVFSGKCNQDNFASQIVTEDDANDKLAEFLKIDSVDEIQATLNTRCANALEPTIDLSVAVGKGPQFLKNYLDGGTTWNENYENGEGTYSLANDKAIIDAILESDGKNAVFDSPDGGANAEYPGYFSNFLNGGKECRLGVITCCYTGSRTSNPLPVNADLCAHDMTLAAKSNHIKMNSYTIFDNNNADDAYCSGFAWEEDSFSDAVKYNTLFHMVTQNLVNPSKGYVKNVPGAPMCGCAEQMPIIDKAACTSVKEGYKIDPNTGDVSVHLSWEDCAEGDLRAHYNSLEKRGSTEKFFMNSRIVEKGTCDEAAKRFMNDRMLIH